MKDTTSQEKKRRLFTEPQKIGMSRDPIPSYALTQDEVEMIFEHLTPNTKHNIRMAAQIALCCYSGLRTHSMLKLKMKDLNFNQGALVSVTLWKTKTKGNFIVPCNSKSSQLMVAWLKVREDILKANHKRSEWVFIITKKP